jgi:hypothetical protein
MAATSTIVFYFIYTDIYICVYIRVCTCGPGSSVGMATGYGLDGPGIESRWGARFFALVQTGPGAHPASCTMGTGYFRGVADHPPRPSAEVKNE